MNVTYGARCAWYKSAAIGGNQMRHRRSAQVFSSRSQLVVLLSTLLVTMSAHGKTPASKTPGAKAPAQATEHRDPCGPEVKDAQQLAEAGLRIYHEAQTL